MTTFNGTNGNDTFTGSAGSDEFNTLTGSDSVRGLGGNDRIVFTDDGSTGVVDGGFRWDWLHKSTRRCSTTPTSPNWQPA